MAPGGMTLRRFAGNRDDCGCSALTRRTAANLHDGVELDEGFALTPPLRRITSDRNERIGKVLRGRLSLQQLRHDHLVQNDVGKADRLYLHQSASDQFFHERNLVGDDGWHLGERKFEGYGAGSRKR